MVTMHPVHLLMIYLIFSFLLRKIAIILSYLIRKCFDWNFGVLGMC